MVLKCHQRRMYRLAQDGHWWIILPRPTPDSEWTGYHGTSRGWPLKQQAHDRPLHRKLWGKRTRFLVPEGGESGVIVGREYIRGRLLFMGGCKEPFPSLPNEPGNGMHGWILSGDSDIIKLSVEFPATTEPSWTFVVGIFQLCQIYELSGLAGVLESRWVKYGWHGKDGICELGPSQNHRYSLCRRLCLRDHLPWVFRRASATHIEPPAPPHPIRAESPLQAHLDVPDDVAMRGATCQTRR
ncbi:hypothetical protein B0T10DRAFT_92550 [Thelonectria olida]|uniref:Uncharacterized protein n=1 Tax=Thelonectria olida TaxID=1576542 RepID=A0A9P8VYM3_9HYPO|nr:hypothetical protein B0T10DRAFT_92550 [Thelonectria olida]